MNQLLQQLIAGNVQALSRCISLVENNSEGYELMLQGLPFSQRPIIGITGAPGAGKSTLVDGLIGEMVRQNKRVAVLCVDPSSPFNRGALLGDRLRMREWYNHPSVYIRSLSSRGALGGVSSKIIEITDVLKSAPFDHIIIETVGVGQNEIEIASIADTTIVVYVPEAGDEVQTMKAGLIEIANIFVVNKADRPGAGVFAQNLQALQGYQSTQQKAISIVKTIATEKKGIEELLQQIILHEQAGGSLVKKAAILAERAYRLIQHYRMKDVNKESLAEELEEQYKNGGFNLYRFAEQYKK